MLRTNLQAFLPLRTIWFQFRETVAPCDNRPDFQYATNLFCFNELSRKPLISSVTRHRAPGDSSVFQSTVSKLLPLVLVFASTFAPALAKQQTVSLPSLNAPTGLSLNCCDPNPTCQPDQSCIVTGRLGAF